MCVKHICVIGAGASGLAAIKCCLDEDLIPTCFERNHDIGGLWRYEEGEKNGATVYKSTYINTSKELMCYSDFPIPKQWPNFMHHSKVFEYYRRYAERFDLMKHIKFNTEVLCCRQIEEGVNQGKWAVKIKNHETGDEKNDLFDGVLVAVGHHAEPHFPVAEFFGLKDYKGKIMHSHEYRDFKGFEDKKVLIIGMGNSGTDIAVELSWHAKQVYLSTRSGAWVLNRVGPRGVPVDFVGVTRYRTFLSRVIPEKFTQKFLEKMLTERFDHAHYGLKPNFGPFNQHALINDDLPNRVLNGSIQIKPDVEKFTGHMAHFDDRTIKKVDIVIFATGYKYSFPFLDESIVKVTGNTKCQLYKYMWPTTLKKTNLAMIGHIQAFGAVNPISELQCRWATRVMKGLCELPSRHDMMGNIRMKQMEMKKRFYASQRHTIEVEQVSYMDEIADQIGVKPNLLKLYLTDRKLASKVLYEICSPCQYRLTGPGKWPHAREMIMTQKERMLFPLHTRPLSKGVLKKKTKFSFIYVLIVLVAVLIIYCNCFLQGHKESVY